MKMLLSQAILKQAWIYVVGYMKWGHRLGIYNQITLNVTDGKSYLMVTVDTAAPLIAYIRNHGHRKFQSETPSCQT